MGTESFSLAGKHVQLQPLDRKHINGLVTAASEDSSLYQWSPVPLNIAEATRYVDTALGWQSEGTAVPFAIVRASDGIVIGSTRFWNLERWAWPSIHPELGRHVFDACEIGYSWLTRSAIRTAVNTEAKLLMLTHAFEKWEVLRVCLHTDVRNQGSRTAIERIGGKFEGVLRAHRIAADFTPRDSARFSILASEWSAVKRRLHNFMERDEQVVDH